MLTKDGEEVLPSWMVCALSQPVDFVLEDWVFFMNRKGEVHVAGANWRSGTPVVSSRVVMISPNDRVVSTSIGFKYGFHGKGGTALGIEAWREYCMLHYVSFFDTEAIDPRFLIEDCEYRLTSEEQLSGTMSC